MIEAAAGVRGSLSGRQWLQLSAALAPAAHYADCLRACAGVANALQPQLRQLLHYHCGVSSLRTRQMMLELQQL